MAFGKKFRLLLMITGIIIFLPQCTQKDETLRIAVSYIHNSPEKNNYIKWLKSVAPDAELLVMYDMPKDSAEKMFSKCHGLLLTGGDDIYPGWHGKEKDTARCGDFDMKRDTMELYLFKTAQKRKMPILGICRGSQLINVAMGGSLYVDLPTDINSNVAHQIEDWRNCYHEVKVYSNGLLGAISGVESGTVNSNHHQAVDRLADGLRVHAISSDGVIESIGWADTLNKNFLLGVQWHPERMDTTSVLSRPLAERFINEAITFKDRSLWKRLQ